MLDTKSAFAHPSTKTVENDNQMPPPLSIGGQLRPQGQPNVVDVMDRDEQEEEDEDTEEDSDSDEDDDGVEEVGMDDSDDEEAEDEAEVCIILNASKVLLITLPLLYRTELLISVD